MKRSPLKPSQPLKRRPDWRGGSMLRKTPLAKFGKRKKELRPGEERCKRIIRERSGGWCEARTPDCTRYATCKHEKRKRSQCGDPTDPANCLDVCWPCNSWIEREPILAHDMGLVTWSEDL